VVQDFPTQVCQCCHCQMCHTQMSIIRQFNVLLRCFLCFFLWIIKWIAWQSKVHVLGATSCTVNHIFSKSNA
jgi:hypothetical protein